MHGVFPYKCSPSFESPSNTAICAHRQIVTYLKGLFLCPLCILFLFRSAICPFGVCFFSSDHRAHPIMFSSTTLMHDNNTLPPLSCTLTLPPLQPDPCFSSQEEWLCCDALLTLASVPQSPPCSPSSSPKPAAFSLPPISSHLPSPSRSSPLPLRRLTRHVSYHPYYELPLRRHTLPCLPSIPSDYYSSYRSSSPTPYHSLPSPVHSDSSSPYSSPPLSPPKPSDEEREEQRSDDELTDKQEEGKEVEPDIANDGEQILVCRRTNACPFHRNRKKRCPANCEYRKTGYTANYAKRCPTVKARVGRCALLDAYLSKYTEERTHPHR